jgi:hypothetical protein
MTDRDIDRIDHSVFYTTDMDATSATYEALGFTLSPLSMHVGSDRPDGERKPMGAGNRCALFGRTYLELLGLFGDGAVDPWNIRPLIAKYEGLHGCSFGDGTATALGGLRPIHPDPEPTTRQCHLLPLDLGAAIRMPGDHPRQAGRPLPVLRAGEGGQLPVSHRQQRRLLCQGME